MSSKTAATTNRPWLVGVREAIPLLGGYIPVAISFGLIAVQSGFSGWEAVLISTLVYAGASQFLFVAMVAAGAPLWFVVVMTLLINARHVVYGPNIAPWLTTSRWWPWLMHGLTDQIFALSHVRLPQLQPRDRMGWYIGVSVVAWFSWIGGTAIGAVAGKELTQRWPLLGEVMPFALPALFLVLLAPRFANRLWAITLGATVIIALLFAVNGMKNAAIPIAAVCGALVYYGISALAREKTRRGGESRNG
ncbi:MULTISPECIES: AzlC family ABC transporter permease [Microbulbifer]|uniref:AzlC family ABC transporter permease n=1 Tax=Microbulbifer celer TaxID=435905 RepID=A0ABW3U7W3_9GAMM|nr:MULTISPECIES: AzlC family ABC transporter permease [Microbulbifer]UFN58650.1 AzlC family ABC transporter permease [Microbulbifer celer]